MKSKNNQHERRSAQPSLRAGREGTLARISALDLFAHYLPLSSCSLPNDHTALSIVCGIQRSIVPSDLQGIGALTCAK